MDANDIKSGIWINRLLTEPDYETLKEWWKWYKFPVPTREMLPDREGGMCGVMLQDGRMKDHCAGFVYFTNSNIAWIEFIISNPEIKDKKTRQEMIRQLIRYLTYLASDNGATVVFTSLTNQNLKGHFEAEGWTVGDEGSTQLIKHV